MKSASILQLLLLLLIIGCASTSKHKEIVNQPPNILFIIADDLTHRDIGCYGSKNVKTPNIDAIAGEGMRFTRCFQAAPMCSPTRHNILTGLYPVKSGAYPNHTFVKSGTKSIAHYLKNENYRVALTGKRHIAPKEAFPFEYLSKGNNPNLTALETFMTEDNSQSFCAFVCFSEPHTPWTKGDPSIYDPEKIELPPYFVDTKETRQRLTEYYAEINHLDKEVGKIRALLERHNLSENTLVIFTSEQGNAFPFAKWTCYDTGLQTAFIAKWPKKIKPNTVSNAMIEYVDVTPTFIDIAGGQAIENLDGTSFLPVLLGETDTHKQQVYGIHTTRGINNGSDYYGIRSVRSEQFKYIKNLTPEITFKNNITQQSAPHFEYWGSWVAKASMEKKAKDLVYRYQHRPGEELYDVVEDPLELNNLAERDDYNAVLKEHRQLLADWMNKQGDRGQATEMEALEHKASRLRGK